MAIARMDVEFAVHGSKISVRRKSGPVAAIAHHTLPFDDPKKTKRTVVG